MSLCVGVEREKEKRIQNSHKNLTERTNAGRFSSYLSEYIHLYSLVGFIFTRYKSPLLFTFYNERNRIKVEEALSKYISLFPFFKSES